MLDLPSYLFHSAAGAMKALSNPSARHHTQCASLRSFVGCTIKKIVVAVDAVDATSGSVGSR